MVFLCLLANLLKTIAAVGLLHFVSLFHHVFSHFLFGAFLLDTPSLLSYHSLFGQIGFEELLGISLSGHLWPKLVPRHLGCGVNWPKWVRRAVRNQSGKPPVAKIGSKTPWMWVLEERYLAEVGSESSLESV